MDRKNSTNSRKKKHKDFNLTSSSDDNDNEKLIQKNKRAYRRWYVLFNIPRNSPPIIYTDESGSSMESNTDDSEFETGDGSVTMSLTDDSEFEHQIQTFQNLVISTNLKDEEENYVQQKESGEPMDIENDSPVFQVNQLESNCNVDDEWKSVETLRGSVERITEKNRKNKLKLYYNKLREYFRTEKFSKYTYDDYYNLSLNSREALKKIKRSNKYYVKETCNRCATKKWQKRRHCESFNEELMERECKKYCSNLFNPKFRSSIIGLHGDDEKVKLQKYRKREGSLTPTSSGSLSRKKKQQKQYK